jgi:hypothetical protein
MKSMWCAAALAAGSLSAGVAGARAPAPVHIDIVAPDGRSFTEIPMRSSDGAWRSYLQAEKGARYEVRVRNASGHRLGLVIAVDGRNIINGRRSELARTEPMYVLDAGDTQSYTGWRANLEAVNEFYFTDWADSYAEAFGDRSARGVIAVAVYREAAPPAPARQPSSSRDEEYASRDERAPAPPGAADAAAGVSRQSAKGELARRDRSAGTGYGDRRVERVQQVEFVARHGAESRHFIKYEWRDTLCRKGVLECGEKNRFWDETVLGFAPPPPRRR